VVYDPDHRDTFTQTASLSQVDYCGFEGLERRGRASVVTLRGEVVVREGEFVGAVGRGTYLPRVPSHF
jgi:dihydropyrimidinase